MICKPPLAPLSLPPKKYYPFIGHTKLLFKLFNIVLWRLYPSVTIYSIIQYFRLNAVFEPKIFRTALMANTLSTYLK